jgi:hypothetical protein
MTPYVQIVSDYVKRLGIENQEITDQGVLEFEIEDMKIQLYRHPAQEAVILDAELFELGEAESAEAQAQRLMLLHQLNALTRFTHGCVAMVDPRRLLLVSRQLPLANLRVEVLQQALDELLDIGADLRDNWRVLSQVVQQTAETLSQPGGQPAMGMGLGVASSALLA